jgi:ABC-type transporter Mla subunit MlaD
MRLEKDDVKIGLLVLLTLGLFVALVLRRGLAALMHPVRRIPVRMEDASGVAVGTDVQLQGLRVGQVEAIQLRRDGVQYHFRATLGLRPDILLWRGTSVLVVSPPVGGNFLDLQLPAPAERREPLADDAELPCDSAPSLTTVVTQISALVGNLNQGVVELRNGFQHGGLGSLLDQPKVARALDELDRTLVAYRRLAEDARGLVAQGGGAVAGADQALADLDRLIGKVQTLLDDRSGDVQTVLKDLAATLEEMQGLGKELREVLRRAGPEGEAGLKSMDRTLRSTEELIELIKTKPNRLIWGKPTPAEREAAEKKVKAAREAQGAEP